VDTAESSSRRALAKHARYAHALAEAPDHPSPRSCYPSLKPRQAWIGSSWQPAWSNKLTTYRACASTLLLGVPAGWNSSSVMEGSPFLRAPWNKRKEALYSAEDCRERTKRLSTYFRRAIFCIETFCIFLCCGLPCPLHFGVLDGNGWDTCKAWRYTIFRRCSNCQKLQNPDLGGSCRALVQR